MARTGWSDAGYKLQDSPAYKDYIEIQKYLADGNVEDLEFASAIVDGFPHGKDRMWSSPWITTAVSSGCIEAVNWMLKKGVQLRVQDPFGYPPLLACIDGRENPDRHQILELLIESGADMNEHGINGWTPLHLAAMLNDETSMRMLLSAGADQSVRTNCDENATAEEEARSLGHVKSADFIANFTS